MKKYVYLLLTLCLVCALSAGCDALKDDMPVCEPSHDLHTSLVSRDTVSLSGDVSVFFPDGGPYEETEEYGSLPAELPAALLQSEALANGIGTEDGWFSVDIEKGSQVFCYRHDGELVWQKEYDFGYRAGEYDDFRIFSAPDGGFLLCGKKKTSSEYWENMPMLMRCDKDGNVLWEYVFENTSPSAAAHVFVMENGEVYTVGEAFPDDGTAHEIAGPQMVYLTHLSADGKLLAERRYGGTDFESVYDVCYMEGEGFAVRCSSQSEDGDFAEGKQGQYLLAMFGTDLSLRWYRWTGKFDFSVFAYDGTLYYQSRGILQTISLSDGERTAAELGTDTVYSFAAADACGVLMQDRQTDKICLFNGETLLWESDFNAGTVERILPLADGGVLVISKNITGVLPTPPEISSIWYSTELVYSGYSESGELLFRDAYDNTRESLKSTAEK